VGQNDAEHDHREQILLLEHRVEDLTAQLETMKRGMDEIAHSLSHDLCAPLRAISGFSGIISERYRNDLDERGRHYFANIVDATHKMNRLIEDLLYYMRLGRGEVVLHTVYSTNVVRTVLNKLTDEIEKCGAQVHVAKDLPAVWADEILLERLLLGLIGNALKFHRAGISPEILIGGERRTDGVILSVADNGIGIDARYHDKIFGIFQRLHGDDAYPGNGLGLAVVAKAAALMKGRVWVMSKLGEGSTFHIGLGPRDVVSSAPPERIERT
jgi:light-regulated signal transduction histidine kinase (bacteriophytochrome)